MSLEISDGEYVVVLGPTGAGKTTLLKIIAGLLKQDTGEIYIDGVKVDDYPPEERNVSLFFQNFALFPHMTILENVAFGLKVRGYDSREAENRALEALRLMHLDNRAYSYPRELSGGMQQRVALARTIITGASILLLDEPLSQLDAKIKSELQYELRDFVKNLGLTALHVTNDVEEALALADRIAIINRGEVVQVGTPFEMVEEPKDVFVAGFMTDMNLMEGIVEEVSTNSVIVDIGNIKLRSSRKGSFRRGEMVIVGVKSKDFKVQKADGELVCRIEDSIFSFKYRKLIVCFDNGLRVQVKTDKSGLEKGAYVSLRVDPNDVYLFPCPKGGLRAAIAEITGVS
ncbi:ABC transporter ATP-binding protein [Candidatus Bathyarchaeota archaeon]|nr:ABC transporter ATP-binding protein [Candidatus Bathyarchaeota archaeon]